MVMVMVMVFPRYWSYETEEITSQCHVTSSLPECATNGITASLIAYEIDGMPELVEP
jgi:hypothetical protein